jgi:hypothetical protein
MAKGVPSSSVVDESLQVIDMKHFSRRARYAATRRAVMQIASVVAPVRRFASGHGIFCDAVHLH